MGKNAGRTRAGRGSGGLYSVHPGVEMVRAWVAALKEKTGRSLDQWVALIREQGPKELKAAREWLKVNYGLGTNSAWWLADRAFGTAGSEDDDPEAYLATAAEYVESMFAGSKAGLRPLYDRLLCLCLSVADDVKACPCKTMVPLYRNHVFAQIRPGSRTRLDLGLALAKHKGKLPAHLVDTGGLARKDRITHRIEITSARDLGKDVEKWLRTAYDLDG